MMHSGDMDYKTTEKSMRLFAKHVAPALADLGSKATEFGPLAERSYAKKKKSKSKAKAKNGKRKAA
jgi:hypothetical protein